MRIEKRNYSHNPWRLVDRDDLEVFEVGPMHHPILGDIRTSSPVCGATRRECETAALNLLERLTEKLWNLQEKG